MKRRDALLVLICSIILPAVEQLLYRRYFPQPRQLHDILLQWQTRGLVAHIFQFVVACGLRIGFWAR